MTTDERQEIKAKFKKYLLANKKLVDNYLEIEYNSAISVLIASENEEARGKVKFIQTLQRMLDS